MRTIASADGPGRTTRELAPRCRAAGARLHRRGSETRPRERPGPGTGHDSVQRRRQGLAEGDAGRRRDNQVRGAVSTVHRTELTEHGTGAGEKMLIDWDLGRDEDWCRILSVGDLMQAAIRGRRGRAAGGGVASRGRTATPAPALGVGRLVRVAGQ